VNRAWERGRLARIAGKGRDANPFTDYRTMRQARCWLAGWVYQNVKQEDKASAAAPRFPLDAGRRSA
jgi:ribosome modulation factor